LAVRLEGMNELLQRINQMGRSLDREVKEKALKEGAELLKEQAKMNVPVRTGNLKEHIIVSNIENDTVHVGPDQQGNAFYGHFLEFGYEVAA
jgi:HK97 gp10 family phage protein